MWYLRFRLVPMPENQPGKGLGHFLGAMRIDAFRPAEVFKKDMDQWLKRFREAKPIDENQKVLVVMIPNVCLKRNGWKNGIPLLSSVWKI